MPKKTADVFIQKLLQRKRIKGAELGRAILLSLVNDYLRLEDPARGPLFNQGELEQMKQRLSSEFEIKVYNDYVNLERALVNFQSVSQGNFQQAQNGMYRYYMLVMDLNRQESFKAFLRQIPVIMTRTQYEHGYTHAKENDDTHTPTATEILGEDASHEDRMRAEIAGIAVLEGEAPDGVFMDAQGNYRDIRHGDLSVSLTDFEELCASGKSCADAQLARDVLILPAVQEIYAYNAFYDIVADAYDIEELRALKIDLSALELEISNINALIDDYLRRISGTDADVARMRAWTRRNFPKIDTGMLEPDPRTVERVKERISDIAAFREPAGIYIAALAGRGEA